MLSESLSLFGDSDLLLFGDRESLPGDFDFFLFGDGDLDSLGDFELFLDDLFGDGERELLFGESFRFGEPFLSGDCSREFTDFFTF
jgi:hypothetical protein